MEAYSAIENTPHEVFLLNGCKINLLVEITESGSVLLTIVDIWMYACSGVRIANYT